MDRKERVERLKKYDAEYKQYLMAKYFSDKTIYGANVYDVKMNIEGQTMCAGRFLPFQSFVNPAEFYELIKKDSSPPTAIMEDNKPGIVNQEP
ncbi:hypothetical protein M569_17507 [Genlisea aurea]|uniref:Uncharacterized protein n=1 Tax=Genlisea aurea TaxID=192259 RepID=S8D3M3_9LAMI|nr:hypothetical protein M569_17507 [Genlisea aurea]